jgi:small subunit ribosomal protein S6
MNKYELLAILSGSLSDETLDAAIKKYTDIIEASAGRILTVNKWGIKKFAYPINFKKDGHYVLLEFESDASIPAKLNSLMNIDEVVYRNLCLRKEA